MKNYARIVNNVVVDVNSDPMNCYHPDIAAQFEEVPDNVTVGSKQEGDGSWTLFENQSIPVPDETPSVDFLAGVDSTLDSLLDLGVIDEKDRDDYRTDIINSRKEKVIE